MIILDTDHFSILKYPDNQRCIRLEARMAASPDRHFVVTAITLEEQMRGWLAEIASTLDAAQQVGASRRLVGLVRFFQVWEILDFDEAAAAKSVALRKAKMRIGTMDLKIGSIATSKQVLLLTANKQDFEKVSGLRFENWLD